MKLRSHNSLILSHLNRDGSITPLEALYLYGCLRLGARIYELRLAGHPIVTRITHINGKRFARYFLQKKKRRRHG